MSLITIPNTFSAGAVIIASQHNSNFSTIATDYNGNIDNTNIASGASIAYSKLNLSTSIVNADVSASAAIVYSKLNLATSIVNADINASAAIVDTKLAQITTASKISGTAITGLASLPVGAGIIPVANLPTTGALNLISTTTVSATTTTSSISITSGNTYLVQYNFVNFSGTDTINVRFNGDTNSNYKFINTGSTTTGVITNLSASAAFITIGKTYTASSTSGINGYFYIRQIGTASQIYRIWGECTFDDSASGGLMAMMNYSGQWANSANATAFTMLTTGNNTTGTVYLYQVATS